MKDLWPIVWHCLGVMRDSVLLPVSMVQLSTDILPASFALTSRPIWLNTSPVLPGRVRGLIRNRKKVSLAFYLEVRVGHTMVWEKSSRPH